MTSFPPATNSSLGNNSHFLYQALSDLLSLFYHHLVDNGLAVVQGHSAGRLNLRNEQYHRSNHHLSPTRRTACSLPSMLRRASEHYLILTIVDCAKYPMETCDPIHALQHIYWSYQLSLVSASRLQATNAMPQFPALIGSMDYLLID